MTATPRTSHPLDDPTHALALRVGRLEAELARSRRRARYLGLGFGFILLSIATTAWSTQGRVTETGALVIRDDEGTIRAQLGVGPEGTTLGMFDERGHLRAGISVAPDGPILNFFGAAGNPRVVLGERSDGAFLVLRDGEGAPRAALTVQADGSPSAVLMDSTMSPIWRRPAEDEGQR